MKRFLLAGATAILAAGCASPPQSLPLAGGNAIASFSAGPGQGLRQQWQPLIITRAKKPTQYRVVSEQGKTFLHARAAAASSGLMQQLDIDPLARPWLHWRWKVGNLIASADNFQRHAEDSPARIILAFDGDKDGLPFADQILFETARVITGRDMPYATMMYVWENKAEVGTVIPNARTGRIKMVVAASGADGIGQWRDFTRNIVDDYEKAFGEKPGRLIGIGVLTDTDNTGETVEAWYGDIRFTDPPGVVARN